MSNLSLEELVKYLKTIKVTTVADFGGGRTFHKMKRVLSRFGLTHDYYDLTNGWDLETRRVEKKYSLIICMDTLEHTPHPELMAHNIEQALDPGGKVFIVAPTDWPKHGKSDYHRFTGEQLAALFPNIRGEFYEVKDGENTRAFFTGYKKVDYDEQFFIDGDEYEKRLNRLQRLENRIRETGATSVLDVGCGQGYFVDYLNRKGYAAEGMDISRFAGKRCPGAFTQHDATLIPWPYKDNQFDAVISADFFEHLEEQTIDAVYAEMQRVGSGNVIAWICYKQERRKNSYHSHRTVNRGSWWQKKLPGIKLI